VLGSLVIITVFASLALLQYRRIDRR